MYNKGDQEMQARFESFKLLLEVLRGISVRKSPVLENLTNLLAHGQHKLHQLLGKLKLKNIYVTTDWSTLRLKRLDNFLDRVARVTTKVDTLVSLPLLEEIPTRSSLQKVMDLLEYFSDPLVEIETFLKEELISLFKVDSY
ncbi:hypothetical protein M0R45_036170 [Rubus argutus]|uniref:Uncharacterized protein n=1 Tax=Rubus argutus TaxID=59490 RepID=A0AAW1VW96_RUBAR